MLNFNFIKSADEICNAIAGNDYHVEISQLNHKSTPSVANMNTHGLFLTYSKLDAPEKEFLLLVENEYEIAEHSRFNKRLIKHMLQTYGDAYLEYVTAYFRDKLVHIMGTNAKDPTKASLRLKEELEPYEKIYSEVKREAAAAAKAKEEKIQAEKPVKQAAEAKPTEAE